jgi:erythromycin esterase
MPARLARAILGLALLIPRAPAAGQRPLNLDMEMPGVASVTLPWGWYLADQDAPETRRQAQLDYVIRHGGVRSLRVDRPAGDSSTWTGGSDLSAAPLVGRRLRLSGWARTEELRGGSVRLRLDRFRAGFAPLGSDSTSGPGLSGTQPWTRLTLETRLDSAVSFISVGAQVNGAGRVWLDDLRLEVDGHVLAEDPGPSPPSRAQKAWLRAHALPLEGVRPGGRDGDLAAFDALLGDARVVSLGEGTHGTREFYQLKHRLIEHLVAERGFGLVLLEANQQQAERLNRYVLAGEGNAREALRGLFRILQTEEVLALVEWARAWNASGRGRVEMVGYDMQDPRLPMDSVLAFLARRDPGFSAAADSAYRSLRVAWLPGPYPPRPDSAVAAWSTAARRVREHLAARRGDYLAAAASAADSAEVAWALQNAEVVVQAASLGDNSPSSVRDSAMAANLAWALAQRPADTRAVVWAHNSHVARAPGWMGGYLERLLPGQVRVVALSTAGGQYGADNIWSRDTRLRTSGVFPITPRDPPRASAAATLVRMQHPVLLVDLRPAREEADGRWLMERRPFLGIGGRAVDYGYYLVPAAEYFDALLFVRDTSPTRRLP